MLNVRWNQINRQESGLKIRYDSKLNSAKLSYCRCDIGILSVAANRRKLQSDRVLVPRILRAANLRSPLS